jgi:prepilin-type N-terminal cleavage/methylation domain-containing protein
MKILPVHRIAACGLALARRRAGARPRAANTRRGFSLIELLCVIVLLGVLAGITALLLRETLGIERAQAAGFERILASNALADQFRADVARAENAELQADPQRLTLKMKNDDQVTYVWQDGQLHRSAVADGKQSKRTLPVGGKQVGVEFGRDGANPKLVRLRLVPLRETSPVAGQTLEIVAALGGNWR